MSETMAVQEVGFMQVDDIAHRMIQAVRDEEVHETLFAAALIIGRLFNPAEEIQIEKETEFVKALLEYSSMYWADGAVN